MVGHISSGVRRIEAVTSLGALNFIEKEENIIYRARKDLNTKSSFEVNDRLKATLVSLENVKEHNEYLETEIAKVMAEVLKEEKVVFEGYNLLLRYLPKVKRNGLLPLYDELKKDDDEHFIILIGHEGDSYPFLVGLGDKVIKDGIESRQIVDILKQKLIGSGGGKPKMAMGSFKNIDRLDEAFELVKKGIHN